MLGNPANRNVLSRLRALEEFADSSRIIAGEGVGVTQSRHGVVISADPDETGAARRGAFDICAGHLERDRETGLYTAGSTENSARFRVTDSGEEQCGLDRRPHSCGIMTVNNQPFEVPYFEGEATLRNRWQYVYAVFTPPSFRDADAFEDPVRVSPPGAEITLCGAVRQSTPEAVFCLLGRVRMRVVKTADPDSGKPQDETVLDILKERQPGELHCTWWGPCLGLLQDQPFYRDE